MGHNISKISGEIQEKREKENKAKEQAQRFSSENMDALDKELNETDYILCYRCREPLNKEEIGSDKYKIDEYCPYCFDDVFSNSK